MTVAARQMAEKKTVVFGGRCRDLEEQTLSRHLIGSLPSGINAGETTHVWLQRLCRELIAPWRAVSRHPQQDWKVCSEMVLKIDPTQGKDMPLNIFAGWIEGSRPGHPVDPP